MKKEKLGFFKKLYLVITDFRTYPFLVKHEKFFKSILYLIILTFIISIVFTTNLILKFNNMLDEVIENYNDKVPEFELSDGTLKVSEKFSEKINSETYIVINTDYTYDEYIKTKEYGNLVIYDTIAIINSDKIILETPASILNLPFEEVNYEVNKNEFFNILKQSRWNLGLLPYVITIYLSVFVGYFSAVFIKILLLAWLISIICFFTGVRLNFKNYIKVAIYAYTLPLIIELISYCLIGTIKNYAYYTNLLLTYVYIIYAIRAIRLDAFILMFSKRNIKKYTTQEFENELNKYNELVKNDKVNVEVDKENKEKEDENKEN